MCAYTTIEYLKLISTYTVQMRKDHMIAVYVTRNFDLAHIGDKPYVCTGCDKDFIYELYKSDMILGNNKL